MWILYLTFVSIPKTEVCTNLILDKKKNQKQLTSATDCSEQLPVCKLTRMSMSTKAKLKSNIFFICNEERQMTNNQKG